MPPKIAILSFPGNNCEVESVRVIRENGMEPMYFRWNDDRTKLQNIDGYFLPGGFAYEDRGRSGMVAARDPLMEFIGQEAVAGKVVIGNCNGAQVLIESGLIPLGKGLQMSLARNAVKTEKGFHAPGFLSEWVWMKPACAKDRCATSNWEGHMHVPIAHGEGRFTTRDRDLYNELRKNDQIAFSYCDEQGNVSNTPDINPNGADFAIAGICNPAGNIVAIMPHPERTPNGHPYFQSMKRWIEAGKKKPFSLTRTSPSVVRLSERKTGQTEIFIDTIITNNEERTVEQAARRIVPSLRLKQWKYFAIADEKLVDILRNLSIFNPHKERAFIRRKGVLTRWNADTKTEEVASSVLQGTLLLRRDEPDTGAEGFGPGAQTGVCYACNDVEEFSLMQSNVLEVFGNPHASTLEKMQ